MMVGSLRLHGAERPALQRLLTQIRERRVDVVVVYKVDRLTRSLTDFARLVELFDKHGVSFVSVTQAFNTTSSMGRLTLTSGWEAWCHSATALRHAPYTL